MKALFGGGLAGLYLVSLLSGMAMGMFNPLIAIHFEKAGLPETVTGYNAGIYYLALVLGGPLTGALIRRLGARAVIACGLCLTGTSTLLFPLSTSLTWLSLVRFAMGAGVCLYMVAGQSLLNAMSDAGRRTATSSLHVVAFGIGLGIGPLFGGLLSRALGENAIQAAGASVLLGLPALLLLPHGRFGQSRAAAHRGLLPGIGVALAGVLAYGAMEGILLTLFPVHLMRLGVAESAIGYSLTAFMLGGGIGLVPASCLGDRWGRRKALACLCLAGFVVLLGVPYATRLPALAALSLALGVCLGPVFPLTLAMIGERLDRADLPAGSGWFTAAFSLGCALGPPLASHAMGRLGTGRLFLLVNVLLAAVLMAIAAEAIVLRKENPAWQR